MAGRSHYLIRTSLFDPTGKIELEGVAGGYPGAYEFVGPHAGRFFTSLLKIYSCT